MENLAMAKKPRNRDDRLPAMVNIPLLDETNEDEVREIRRLMKRKIPNVLNDDDDDDDDDRLCAICYSETHDCFKCPCKKKIPKGSNITISPRYDTACRGCGDIGLECCSRGSYAVLKSCLFCKDSGHWFWEQRCPDDKYFRPHPEQYFVFKSIRDDDIVSRHPPKLPRFPTNEKQEIEEIRRLMKRERTAPVQPGCCYLCYAKDHLYYDCSFLKIIPQGSAIGPTYDEICIGCGRIGMRCCSQGAYATPKYCTSCHVQGHWYWEETDQCHHRCPPSTAKKWATFKNEHSLPQDKDIVRDIQKLTT